MSDKKGRTEWLALDQQDSRDFNPDPLVGWHALYKPTRLSRESKRTWRRKSGGAIQVDLLALLILATVADLVLAVVML